VQYLCEQINTKIAAVSGAAQPVGRQHLQRIQDLRETVGTHTKILAVVNAVTSVLNAEEKVVLFCHHHATAQELAVHLGKAVGPRQVPRSSDVEVSASAWAEVFKSDRDSSERDRSHWAFITWLCAANQRAQVAAWIGHVPSDVAALVQRLMNIKPRHPRAQDSIAVAAKRLYDGLMESTSGRAVLTDAFKYPERLLSSESGHRVLSTSEAVEGSDFLFMRNTQPDTVMAIFNTSSDQTS